MSVEIFGENIPAELHPLYIAMEEEDLLTFEAILKFSPELVLERHQGRQALSYAIQLKNVNLMIAICDTLSRKLYQDESIQNYWDFVQDLLKYGDIVFLKNFLSLVSHNDYVVQRFFLQDFFFEVILTPNDYPEIVLPYSDKVAEIRHALLTTAFNPPADLAATFNHQDYDEETATAYIYNKRTLEHLAVIRACVNILENKPDPLAPIVSTNSAPSPSIPILLRIAIRHAAPKVLEFLCQRTSYAEDWFEIICIENKHLTLAQFDRWFDACWQYLKIGHEHELDQSDFYDLKRAFLLKHLPSISTQADTLQTFVEEIHRFTPLDPFFMYDWFPRSVHLYPKLYRNGTVLLLGLSIYMSQPQVDSSKFNHLWVKLSLKDFRTLNYQYFLEGKMVAACFFSNRLDLILKILNVAIPHSSPENLLSDEDREKLEQFLPAFSQAFERSWSPQVAKRLQVFFNDFQRFTFDDYIEWEVQYFLTNKEMFSKQYVEAIAVTLNPIAHALLHHQLEELRELLDPNYDTQVYLAIMALAIHYCFSQAIQLIGDILLTQDRLEVTRRNVERFNKIFNFYTTRLERHPYHAELHYEPMQDKNSMRNKKFLWQFHLWLERLSICAQPDAMGVVCETPVLDIFEDSHETIVIGRLFRLLTLTKVASQVFFTFDTRDRDEFLERYYCLLAFSHHPKAAYRLLDMSINWLKEHPTEIDPLGIPVLDRILEKLSWQRESCNTYQEALMLTDKASELDVELAQISDATDLILSSKDGSVAAGVRVSQMLGVVFENTNLLRHQIGRIQEIPEHHL